MGLVFKKKKKSNYSIQLYFFLLPILCFLVVVAHPGDKAFLRSVRPNHNTYQKFNILCGESGRRFSYYNRICQFSVT